MNRPTPQRVIRTLAMIAVLGCGTMLHAQTSNGTKHLSPMRPAASGSGTAATAGSTQRCLSTTSPSYSKSVMDSLEARYKCGLGDATCVFSGEQQAAYDQGWMDFINGLVGLDASEGISSLGVMVYFSREGTVDRLLYTATGVDEERFQKAAELFCEGFKFPLQGTEPFKQCTSVEFQRQ